MTKMSPEQRGIAIPIGRFNRLARLGGVTTAVAGNVAAKGGFELLRGRKPRISDLLLTPSNISRVAEQLARMRGAAMKAGQLLSMETADMLPPELAQIMGRLRGEAHFMPPSQLKKVLMANWGRDFLKTFKRFDVHPIAAASIGQVHRAQTKDGCDLAIKVQYPGVRDSIDSDMRNLGMILRASGMLPKGFDLDRLLADGTEQLREETDYIREAEALERFAVHLQDHTVFKLPSVHKDLSTKDILVMDYLEGEAIETLENADQDVRDRVATELIALTLREAFELRDMQTDPNFANYRYVPKTGQIILFDFGATRQFSRALSADYLALFQAAVASDNEAAFAKMVEIGLVGADMSASDQAHILQLFDLAAEPLRQGGVLDFGTCGLLARLRRAGLVLAEEQVSIHAPPTDTLLFQRKVLGCYLLAERLRARVDLTPLIARYRAA
ncbi:ABC1 kinase family protein [Roseovarius rhodophyticola]|uniref:AarF/ABC1/UbiB kinase family protein n=1 Tax=Roseovarius rhodophyticola TaxID=3080827 RepID=A0ABZ2TG06_9RHOB|nr:AarF/ABC1/UbiB kinase family protein [Roseovarius sp. W115]MDV2928920.1 AarF/ABC1/UbiB kinase family protein [Roseovarius sp. W115]